MFASRGQAVRILTVVALTVALAGTGLVAPVAGQQSSTAYQWQWAGSGGDGGSSAGSGSSGDGGWWGTGGSADDPVVFSVEIVGTNGPITEGETVRVTVDVTNTGDRLATQEVELTRRDSQLPARNQSQYVTLASGQSRQLTFLMDTVLAGANDWLYVAESESRAEAADDSTRVTVRARDDFEVGAVTTNSPVEAGETVSVTATLTNVRWEEVTQEVVLQRDGRDYPLQRRDVTIQPLQDTSVSFTWNTTPGDVGTYTLSVETDGGSASTDVAVERPAGAAFEVASVSTNEPVYEGETIQVDATVRNGGQQAGTTNVTFLEYPDEVLDGEGIRLAPGESETVRLTADTTVGGGNPVRSYDVTAGESRTRFAFALQDLVEYDVVVDDTNSPVEAGETARITATVTNEGIEQGTTDVVVKGLDTLASERLTVDPGESETVTLGWNTSVGDETQYLEVRAGDARERTTLTIEPATS